ncbi:MAG: glycosyltransferase family 2 protein [Prolixibacteraceae bacterium]|nr:glycosyltransferase family 2 protein [Prolixibacteraceae bacterium]
MKSPPTVYIIILNWNGWKDTIECLESVFRLNYDNYRVIVCDNDSSDGSLDKIKAWADGRLDVFVPLNNRLRHLSYPPVVKKIPYQEYNRIEAEAGGDSIDADCSLILIQTGDNLGFAGGNNVGLRYALARNDFEFVWLLNNDTVVEFHALSALVEKAEAYKVADAKVGLIGAKLMYYDQPEVIQAVGGVYNKWFGTTKHVGSFEQDNGQYDTDEVTNKIDYPIGASMFVAKHILLDIGLMCEDYFLYFEEIDWVFRAKKNVWHIGYCWATKVYHKEGRSIGSNSKSKSELSEYYALKNRIVFTKKTHPQYLWSVRTFFLVVLFNRIRRRQFGRLGLVLNIVLDRSLQHNRTHS